MVDRDELRALAAGTPPAPARVVMVDAACVPDTLDAPVGALQKARLAGCRSTLRLAGLDAGSDAPETLAAIDARLALEGGRLAPDALALPAAVARPGELALGAAGACDVSPVYLLLPAGALEAVQRGRAIRLLDGVELDARRWWGSLLALAATAPAVSLVPELPGPGLATLAPSARWLGPSPGVGELVPGAPQRLRLSFDFGMLIDASENRPSELRRLAERLVVMADELLGRLPPDTGMRRLALALEGIGHAALRRGFTPGSHAALNWARERLWAFREGARAASVALARSRGGGAAITIPGGLEVADADDLERDLLIHGARHSHLLCLSPWSLAPPELGRRGLGLLPALAAADGIAWRRPDTECTPELYSEALRFAWAVALRS